MDRATELSAQRKMIEEKKQEILRRVAEKRKATTSVKDSSESSTNSSTTSSQSSPNPGENLFKNDGSFLERFKKMQEAKENESKSSKPMQGISMKLQSKQQSKTLETTPAQMKLNVDDDDEEDKVPTAEDRAVRLAVEKVAISVAVNGATAEDVARVENDGNPAYEFLKDKDGLVYKLFQQRVADLTEAKKRAEADGHLMTFDRKDDNIDEQADSKKRKKSRWGPQESEAVVNAIPAAVQKDPGLISYALQVFGTTDLTPEQWKQLEDQQKMRLLYEMMKAKERQEKARKLAGKVKYEYDSDEEVDGGTWEHRKRASEMEKTKAWAEALTEQAKGKHHIGDFLPPDELERFMEKWEAVKQGRTPDLSDYKEHKITSDNVGYQLLQKLGWSEGQGLGANGTGIINPVSKGTVPVENAGLGQTRPDDITNEDDEYEAYRKRMMLAYRFRPNPLNNPRRPYY